MKTTLTFERCSMLGASLGGENPLPDIQNLPNVHSGVQFDQSISAEESKYFTYGRVKSILPYRKQDGYDRVKRERQYDCVVLENEHLRAVFFPQFGGKLWSLYDKDHDRHLVHNNPVFQPANLALRNAWISGGVEWNLGMTGHSPLTLSQLHTAVLKLHDGTPVLRMYEWERIRRISYQIDAYLPEDSRFLFVRIHLCNTQNREVPVYWWSNIAVDETEDTRVLAPADKAFCFDYSRVMTKRDVPMYDGKDCSYTTQIPRAMDLFFDLPQSQRKWEAALDKRGEGLIQTSTDLLQGRKLFLWGNSSGGKHWQEYLSVPGKAYLEIQAGLANTQMEHLPMPANAKWEWLEAYGMMCTDPQKVHGDWKEAYSCVEAQLERDLPRALLDAELERLRVELDQIVPPVKTGSGWAALELRRLEQGDQFPGECACFASASMGREQEPWKKLLETGVFPHQDPHEMPAAYLTQEEWTPLLKQAIECGNSDHWHAWLQLGVMYCAQGDLAKAEQAFLTSLERTDNGWAWRNLAMLNLLKGEKDAAADQMQRAVKMLPILPVAIECGNLLIDLERWCDFNAFYQALPPEIQSNGRMQVMYVHAAIGLNEFDSALRLLKSGIVVSDVREGEVLLSDLWIKLHMRRIARQEDLPEDDVLRKRVLDEFPVPTELDFRMNPDA